VGVAERKGQDIPRPVEGIAELAATLQLRVGLAQRLCGGTLLRIVWASR